MTNSATTDTVSHTWLGALLVAAGAVMLASKGLFAKALYAQGLSHHDVAGIRSVLAIPGFIAIAYASRRKGPSLAEALTVRRCLIAGFAGLLCYYIGALANFYALTLIQANVERALLFSYPAIVVIFQAVITRTLPSANTLIALGAAIAGIVLVTGVLDAGLNAQQLEGVAFVLACSVTIATYFMISAPLTRTMGAANFTAVAMTIAGIAFGVHYALVTENTSALNLSRDSWGVMLGLIIFATILPLIFIAEGVRRVGASRGAVISTVGPPATAVMAYQLYGETFTPLQILGTLAIIGAVLFLESRSRSGS